MEEPVQQSNRSRILQGAAKPALVVSLLVGTATDPARASPETLSRTEPTTQSDRPDFVGHHWAAELPALGLTFGVAASSLERSQIDFSGGAPDAGFHSYDPVADRTSDFTGDVGGALIGLTVGSSLELLHLRNEGFLYSTLIATEAWLLGAGVTRLLKQSVGRCRPLAWDEATESCDPSVMTVNDPGAREDFAGDEAFQAMPSGHTSTIAAVSGAYFWLALRSRRPSIERWLAFGVTQTMAWTTVGLRVAAGAHSTSDTLASWGLNTALGVAVAAVHPRAEARRKEPVDEELALRQRHRLRLRLVPRGAGLAVIGRF